MKAFCTESLVSGWISFLHSIRRVYEDKPEQLEKLEASEDEPSLSDLVQVIKGNQANMLQMK